jgi:hypothetical protein
MYSRLLLAGLLVGGTVGQATAQTAPVANNAPPPAIQPASPAASVPSDPSKTPVLPVPAAPAAAVPAAPTPEKYVVPAGTKILLSLKSAVNTKTARPGDGVYLVSTFPVVENGHVLIPEGIYVQGVVDRVVRPGHVKGRAQISMHFTTLIFPNGRVVSIPGTVNSLPGSSGPQVKGNEGTVQQQSQVGRDAGDVAKGAGYGLGAGAIGGLASGNAVEGLGYGALAGGAAGAIYTLFTRGDDINIPNGAPLEMVLQRPLSLEAQQYAVVDASRQQMQQQMQQYVPVDQQQPLEKPTCPTGITNCH